MQYTSTDEIIDDLQAVYDSQALVGSTSRRARLLNYVNRAADELWILRTWTFTIGRTTITFTNGVGALPTDFFGVGDGGLYDQNGRAWVEVPYNDLVSENLKSVNTRLHLYALSDVITLADANNNQDFTFVYTMQAPQYTDGDDLTPMPSAFGRAILLGAAMFLKRDEGDLRPQYEQEYRIAQSQLCKAFPALRSRPMQMPMAVGNGRW